MLTLNDHALEAKDVLDPGHLLPPGRYEI